MNPEAFGSTYEREAQFSLNFVSERLKPTKDKFVLGAFDCNNQLVGIVTFMRENNSPIGNVYGMYISPEERRKGVGKLLMIELINKAKNCEGLKRINLKVVSNNYSAIKLYQSLGFEVYGVEINAINYKGQFFDEDLMVFKID